MAMSVFLCSFVKIILEKIFEVRCGKFRRTSNVYYAIKLVIVRINAFVS